MLQISVYPCRMCVLLLYTSWLSTSADLSKFLKSLSLSRLISPHCSLHEMGWKERQQKYLCRGKLRFHPEKSPNLKNSEENAIEKDCFPQPFVVIPSKSGVVKGLAYKSQVESALPSLFATGEQRLFLPAYAI